MHEFIYDEVDRSQLQPLEGMVVAFTGKVQQVASPSKNKKFVCIQNVRLAEIDNNVCFTDRQQYKCQHMWLDVSDIHHVKHQMYLEMEGCAEVFKYTRKDGSASYGLRFKTHGMTETCARKRLVESLQQVNLLDISVEEKADAVKQLVAAYTEMLEENTIVLFTTTIEKEVKSINDLQGRMMRCAGVHTTINRSGRRSSRTRPHRKVYRSEAKGFC